MKKFSIAILCAAAVTALCAETPTAPRERMLETGAEVPELAGAWSKGTPVKLAEQRGKNVVVFYFWAVNQQTLEDMPRFAAVAKKYQGQPVTFAAVGCDRADKVAGFFRVRELPLPVLIDDKLTLRTRFLHPSVRLPQTAIVDKEGRLVWRGVTAALPAVLDKVLDGSFDLKEHIRRERFADRVRAALARSHYEEAVAIIDGELATHPANVELVSLKATLLARALKHPEQALKAVDEALQHAPKEIAFLEIKMKLLYSMHDDPGLERFYAEVCKTFADQPTVLMRFAGVEMRRPVFEQRPELYRMLMTAAHNSKNFKDDRERGFVEMGYAQMLMMCGRPELAVRSAERALKLLDGTPTRKEAETMLAFYRRVVAAAKNLDK